MQLWKCPKCPNKNHPKIRLKQEKHHWNSPKKIDKKIASQGPRAKVNDHKTTIITTTEHTFQILKVLLNLYKGAVNFKKS